MARKSRIAPPPREPSEFDRFQDLTERLVAVPKKELDKAREKEAKAKR